MKARHKRFTAILLTLLGIGVAVGFILKAMQSNLLYYSTPTQLLTETPLEQKAKKHHLGGMVKAGSVNRTENSLDVSFVITDYTYEVPVYFSGILPDLFREEQGIVAIGHLKDGRFEAQKVLAKHDEKYMPPDIKLQHKKENKPDAANNGSDY